MPSSTHRGFIPNTISGIPGNSAGPALGSAAQGAALAALTGAYTRFTDDDTDEKSRNRRLRNRMLLAGAIPAVLRSGTMYNNYRHTLSQGGGRLKGISSINKKPWQFKKRSSFRPSSTGFGYDFSSVPPPSGSHYFPVGYSSRQIAQDPYLSIPQKAVILNTIDKAGQGRRGLINSKDVARAAVGGAVGYGAASLLGKTLGATFGLPPSVNKKIQGAGVLAGMLRNTGIWQ